MEVCRQFRRLNKQVEAEYRLAGTSSAHTSSIETIRTDRSIDSDFTTVGTEKEKESEDGANNVTDEDSYGVNPLPQKRKVDWNGPDDLSNPLNWSKTYRAWVFFIVWINVFTANYAASADSAMGKVIANQFHVSEEAEALSATLYTFGVAAGALIAVPFSATIGRYPLYTWSRLWNVIWLFAAALAPNFTAQCFFRFLAGTGGSLLLAIHGACVADIYNPLERSIAWPTIAMASFLGISSAPIIGGWLAQSAEHGDVSWRWVEWIALIMSAFSYLLTLLCYPETFAPVILKWKAQKLRELTGSSLIVSDIDSEVPFMQRLVQKLKDEFHMATRESIVILLGAWLIVVYVVVFGFLQGFSFIFGSQGTAYKWQIGSTESAFGAVCVGVTLWYCISPVYWHYYKLKQEQIRLKSRKSPSEDVENAEYVPELDLPSPEYRLWMAVHVAPLLPTSLFWLGWTVYPSISPWSGLGAIVLFGISWAGIYVSVYQYILDVYGIHAATALAVITFLRYTLSGVINIVSRPMYDRLGVHWTMTLFGIIGIILAPAPFIFIRYGSRCRRRSRLAHSIPAA